MKHALAQKRYLTSVCVGQAAQKVSEMAARDVDFVFARLHGVAHAEDDEVAEQVQLVDGCVGKVHAALPENAVLLVLGGPGRHVAPWHSIQFIWRGF